MIYPNNKRYYTYDSYLKQTFGTKAIKIPLDGSFSCPNIDGTKGVDGCRYCNKQPLPYRGKPLYEQWQEARLPLLQKWGKEDKTPCYIPYFQVFSGTYAPLSRLRALYEEALALPNTVGLSIATRCDCLGDEVVALLWELHRKTHLTVELGLQTVHEETANRIGRGHSYEEFLRGYASLQGLNVCLHLINGLPGENKEKMLETAKAVAALRPHSVKIHMLYLEEGTALTKEYQNSPFPMLSLEEYVDITVSQLELLPPDTVIERLTGDGQGDRLIAPLWTRKKRAVLNSIDKELKTRNTYQGIYFP